jgi:hypothetical protein
MTRDKLVRGIAIAAFAPAFGEFILLVPFEQGKALDVVEIIFAASIPGERRLTPCSSCEARELSLNAHISRSVVENPITSAVRN